MKSVIIPSILGHLEPLCELYHDIFVRFQLKYEDNLERYHRYLDDFHISINPGSYRHIVPVKRVKRGHFIEYML